jgi:hypothetical protein
LRAPKGAQNRITTRAVFIETIQNNSKQRDLIKFDQICENEAVLRWFARFRSRFSEFCRAVFGVFGAALARDPRFWRTNADRNPKRKNARFAANPRAPKRAP